MYYCDSVSVITMYVREFTVLCVRVGVRVCVCVRVCACVCLCVCVSVCA